MPAIQPPARVLVTGASGFLGPHIIKALLVSGFDVRASVRGEDKVAYLKETFPTIEVVITPDMTLPGTYDEAVKDIDGVVHAASPLDVTNTGDPALVIEPAVHGVTGILKSMEASGVKRIVHISSLAAVTHGDWDNGKRTFDEEKWNTVAPDLCEAKGAAAPPFVKYLASKTLAERAFWEYFKTTESKFDGVALAVSVIIGEPMGFAASKGRLEGSNTLLLPWMTRAHTQKQMRKEVMPIVDTGDVAMAAVRSLMVPGAGGERFLVTTGPVHLNDFAIAAHVLKDDSLTRGNMDPAYRKELEDGAVTFDTGKAKKILGMKIKEKDEVLEGGMRAVKAFMDRNPNPNPKKE